MGELKQRRKGGDSSKKKQQQTEAVSTYQQQLQPQAQQQPQTRNAEPFGRWKKYGMTVLLLCLYIPFIAVINPATVPSLYFRFSATPCQGVCNVPKQSGCQVDALNLVFMRIAKTGTTTILSVLERGLKLKNVRIFDLRELEDVVSSIELKGAALDRMGYHDPALYQERVQQYYQRASKTMLYPPYRAQERNILEGHFVYFNFTKNAARLVGPEANYLRYMPTWLKQHYHLERPKKLQMQQITILRHPQDRLKSMYYYDRHEARTSTWRELLVEQQGNATLQDCLLNQTCIQVNKLRQWCSLQTESLCGIGKKCRPATTASLEIAKQNLLQGYIWVGITEQMQESLKLLQHVLPTYLEGVSLESVPRKKSSEHIDRESSFLPEAQAALDNLCALDNELYEYAKQVLQERMEACLPSS